MRILVTFALFCAAIIALAMQRVRRDAGGRVDTLYFQRLGYIFTFSITTLAVALMAGLGTQHPLVRVVGMGSAYLSVLHLVFFAYSFPRNVPVPRALVWPASAFTLVCTALSLYPGALGRLGPALMHAFMVPYFVATLYFLRRNWRDAVQPGQRWPSAPVLLVQASVLVPWLISGVFFGLLPGPLRVLWVTPLTQALVMAVLVVGGIGTAILRYHLFEIRVVMAEVALSVTAAAAFAGYVGLAAEPLLSWLSAHVSRGFAVAFVAAVPPFVFRWGLGALEHHTPRVATSTDRGAPPPGLIEQTVAESARTVDPDAVLRTVLDALAVVTGAPVRFLRHGAIPAGPWDDADPALVSLCAAHPRAHYARVHAPEVSPALRDWLHRLDASMLVPLRREGVLYGLLVVGPGCHVTHALVSACVALADHLALKLENSALYAEVAEASRALEESRRLAALGAFAAALAHDIRTPLTSACMNVQMLRARPDLPASEREPLDIAGDELKRLQKTLDAFLEYARAPKLSPRPIDLREFAEDLLGPLRARHPGASLRLVEAAPNAPWDDVSAVHPTAHATHAAHAPEAPAEATPDDDAVWRCDVDEAGLRRAVEHLVDNAVRASGDQPAEVELVLRHTDDAVHLGVRDHGPGIDPALRAQVFEPFFSTRPDSTGLGLAVARKVARAHGGELHLDPPDALPGTSFTLSLPRKVEASPSA